MRAAFYERTGSAQEVLSVGQIPVPRPDNGEVLVRVHVSGVNPSDVKTRAGRMRATTEFPRIVPHSDGAGVIKAVGAGVSDTRIGERVWLWNAQWKRPGGTAAELTALPADQAVPLPDHVSFSEGACLGIPAETAWVAAMEGKPGPGRSVLVHGGAGAVGSLAIAIAAEAGARVIATASTDEKAAIAKAAGADAVIRYRDTDTAAAVLELTGGNGVDHIVDVDFGANWQVNAASIATNGSIAAYSAPSKPVFQMDYYAFAAKAARLRFIQVYLLPPAERVPAIAGIDRLLRANRLPIRIGRHFALDQIVDAHELQESGTVIGNIVIDVC
ncbi:MAG TPA: NADPH:quinone reductase [Thermohalobaculum sp.]|nr:NADPH:quinone reductase [Thermohalobaculum sp.]